MISRFMALAIILHISCVNWANAKNSDNTIFHDELSQKVVLEKTPTLEPTNSPDKVVIMTFSLTFYGVSISSVGVSEEKVICHAIAQTFGLQTKYVTVKALADASDDASLSYMYKTATENKAVSLTFSITLSLLRSGFDNEKSLYLAVSGVLQGIKGVYSKSFSSQVTTAASMVEANALLGVQVVPSTLSAQGYTSHKSYLSGSTVDTSASLYEILTGTSSSSSSQTQSSSTTTVTAVTTSSSSDADTASVEASVSEGDYRTYVFENGDFEEDANKNYGVEDVTPTGWEKAEGVTLVDCSLVKACRSSQTTSEVAVLDRTSGYLQHQVQAYAGASIEIKFSVYNYCRVCPCVPVPVTVKIDDKVLTQYTSDESNSWDNVVLRTTALSSTFSLSFATNSDNSKSCGVLLDDVTAGIPTGTSSSQSSSVIIIQGSTSSTNSDTWTTQTDSSADQAVTRTINSEESSADTSVSSDQSSSSSTDSLDGIQIIGEDESSSSDIEVANEMYYNDLDGVSGQSESAAEINMEANYNHPTKQPSFKPTKTSVPSSPTSRPRSTPSPVSDFMPTQMPSVRMYSPGCPVEVSLQDTFGDSWNGAYIVATNAKSVRGEVNYMILNDISSDDDENMMIDSDEKSIGFWPTVGGDGTSAYVYVAQDYSVNGTGYYTSLFMKTGDGKLPRESWEILWSVKVNGKVYTGDFNTKMSIRCTSWTSSSKYKVELVSIDKEVKDTSECDDKCKVALPLQQPKPPPKPKPSSIYGSSSSGVGKIDDSVQQIGGDGVDYSDYSGSRYPHIDEIIPSLSDPSQGYNAVQSNKDNTKGMKTPSSASSTGSYSDYSGVRYPHLDSIISSMNMRRLEMAFMDENVLQPILLDSGKDKPDPSLPSKSAPKPPPKHFTALSLEVTTKPAPKDKPDKKASIATSITSLPKSAQAVTYVISDNTRMKPLVKGSICTGPGSTPKSLCPFLIPDGDYILRVGGAVSSTSTVEYGWSFCGMEQSVLQTELSFQIYSGQCWPGETFTAEDLVTLDTMVQDTATTYLTITGTITLTAMEEQRNSLTSTDKQVFSQALCLALANEDKKLASVLKVSRLQETGTDGQTVTLEFTVSAALYDLNEYSQSISGAGIFSDSSSNGNADDTNTLSKYTTDSSNGDDSVASTTSSSNGKSGSDSSSSSSGLFNYEQVQNIFYNLRHNLASFLASSGVGNSWRNAAQGTGQYFLELLREQEVSVTGGAMVQSSTEGSTALVISSVSSMALIDMDMTLTYKDESAVTSSSDESKTQSARESESSTDGKGFVSRNAFSRETLFKIALFSGGLFVFSAIAVTGSIIRMRGDDNPAVRLRLNGQNEYVSIEVLQ